MRESVKIEISGPTVHVHYRRPDWSKASKTILFNRENPPDGYRLEAAAIVIRSKKGGRAVSLRLSFRHISEDVTPFTIREAYSFFRESVEPAPESASRTA